MKRNLPILRVCRIVVVCTSMLCMLNGTSSAQSDDSTFTELTPDDRMLRLHLLDAPSNTFIGYYWPSWKQSIYITKDVHQAYNRAMGDLLEPIHPFWGKAATVGAIGVFNVFHLFIPTGLAWQHQEAHRAILGYHDIDSYNQTYEFRLFQMRQATMRVLDQDLVDFKAEDPYAFNRNRGAGHEGQIEMMNLMKKDAFVYGTPGYRDVVPYFLNTYVIISFLNEWKQDDYDEKIDIRNSEELTPPERDISGVEFTPWVYDLFRPDEPYDQRGENGGVHEYGAGIDRYIGNTDLTQEEKDYLKKQSGLVWINALSPTLFGFPRFKGKNPFNHRPMYWNVNFIHNLTGFGYVIDGSAFFQQDKWNLFFTVHNYFAQDIYGIGLEAEVFRYPAMPDKLFLSGTTTAWLQPEDHSFYATKLEPGAQLRFDVSYRFHKCFEVFLDADIKTKGYVAGIPTINSFFQASTGINIRY